MNHIKGSPKIRSVLKRLFNTGITTNEEFMALSEEDIRQLGGFGSEKIEVLRIIKSQITSEDLFEEFRIPLSRPIKLSKFFKNGIYRDNVLTYKLVEIEKKVKLTPTTIAEFSSLKSRCLEERFSNTAVDDNISSEEVKQALTNRYLKGLLKYLNDSEVKNIKINIYEMMKGLHLVNVNLDKYGDTINTILDYEFHIRRDIISEKEIIFRIISKERKEISFFKLRRIVNSLSYVDVNNLPDHMKKLANEGFIMYTSQGVRYKNPTIIEYVKIRIRNLALLNERLNGKTLQEIGSIENVTRERIRQKVKKIINEVPKELLYEWKFIEFYKKYDLTYAEFCNIFQITRYQYEWLKLSTKLSSKPKLSVNDLLNDVSVTIVEKNNVLAIINKDKLIIDDMAINDSNASVWDYCLEKYAKEDIKAIDLLKKHNDLCEKYNLQYKVSKVTGLLGYILRSDIAVYKYGSVIRFFKFNADVEAVIRDIDFRQYNNQEISARKIFLDYLEEMKEVDIRDEYELHNILKKRPEWIPKNVTINRMPLMLVGCVDKEEQVLNLLIELSPISIKDFTEEYANRYGNLIQTVQANYLSFVEEYKFEDGLRADLPMVSYVVRDNLKKILKDDFYFKEDVDLLYKSNYSSERLPGYIYPKVGYKNFQKFILRNEYLNSEEYFEKEYFEKELFTIDDNRLNQLGAFRNKLNKSIEQLEIFEYEHNEFINIQKIESVSGIQKKNIKYLVQKILDYMGDRYFTVENIQNIIEESELNQLGFENIFYETILKHVEEIRFQYIGNRVVFKKTKNKFYTNNFIEEIVSRFKSIDIYELLDYMDETYGVKLQKSKVVDSTEQTAMYYHPIMERMYQDMEEFNEMMEE